MNIAICDDEQLEQDYLLSLATRWGNENKINAQIKIFSSAEDFLYQENKEIDILLLDIQMKSIDGIFLAKHIRKENERMQIIFITGIPDFILEGYEVSALHYLMKPVDEDKLFEVLTKAVKKLQKAEKSLLLIIDGETVKIPQKDILYCESLGHNMNIVTENGLFETKMPISSIEKLLDNSFIRCHRSYIVGIQHINRITKTDVILDNGKAVPLSRRLYNEINQVFIKYYMSN